jgi:hypothetical protein
MTKFIKNYSIAFICLTLAICPFFYVYFFGINVAHIDDWDFVLMVKKYLSEGISFSLLSKPHNEHIIFFPRLFYISVLAITQMNSKIFMYFNAFLICLEFMFLYLIATKQFKFPISKIPLWILIIPLFVFNLRQWQNLIWAFQMVFYFVIIFTIMTLYFIELFYSTSNQNRKLFYFLLSIIFGIIATFSCGMGMIVWIAGGIQILIKNIYIRKPYLWIYGIIWAIIGIIAFIIYSNGIDNPVNPNTMFIITHPFKFLYFFFSLISMISVHSLSILAFPLGVLLFAVSIYVIYKIFKNKRLQENSFWIALFIYSILFSIMTTLGRGTISFEYTDRSRYTSFTSLMTISMFVMFYDVFRHSINIFEKKIFKLVFIGLLVLAIGLNAIGLAFGFYEKKERLKIKEIVLNYKTKSDKELFAICVGCSSGKPCYWCENEFVNMVKENCFFLEKNHYNAFIQSK